MFDKLSEAAAVRRMAVLLETRARRLMIEAGGAGHCAACGETWPCTVVCDRTGRERTDVPGIERARHTRK